MSAGIGPGSTNRQPARPRHDAAEPEISGATCLWSQRQIPHQVHAWKWGPVTRWCTGVDEDAAPRASAAPGDAPTAGMAAGDGTDGPDPSERLSLAQRNLVASIREALSPLIDPDDDTVAKRAEDGGTIWTGAEWIVGRIWDMVLPAHEAMVRAKQGTEHVDRLPHVPGDVMAASRVIRRAGYTIVKREAYEAYRARKAAERDQIEQEVRAKVAEEIEAAPIHKILAEDESGKDVHAAWCPGCRAARIARGGQA